MKNYKKIGHGLWLGLLVGFALFALLGLGGHKAYAAVIHDFGAAEPFASGVSKYTLKNGKITITIPLDIQGDTQKITFTNTSAKPLTYTSDVTFFCAAATAVQPGGPAVITLTSPPKGSSVSGKLTVYYFNGSGCSGRDTGNITVINQDTSTGGGASLPSTLSYNGNTYSLVDPAYPLYGLNVAKGNDCYGGSVIVANAAVSSGEAYLDLGYNPDQSVSALTPLSRIVNQDGLATSSILNLIQGCGFSPTAQAIGYKGAVSNGKLNAAGPATQNQDGPTQTTCEANSNGFSFAWAVCPVMDAASALTNTLLGYFEDQLSFTVGQLGSSSNPNSGNYKVHHSWSIVKDIASSLVIIIMLVMILSQAISFGPFDAYTIRKLMPKLVAAVILMQISWPLFAYAIDLVNDLARGLADIMYLPFGGSQNMDLFSLLGNAHLGGIELGVLNWAAIGVGIALGVAFLFTMLGVAFTAIVSLFFAFLTLVFRKILIILLLIFSPLAILAWILPGTERYWKMWRENFFKALFMFPILVAIIAGGRVFAYVVGTQNNGEFLNLIFILVGFFGPLFLAPRTFKWGGQAMQMAGNGIMKASSKVSERPKKFLDKRQEGWSAERKRQSQERYTHDVGFNWRAPWRRPLDLVRSGEVDPTLWGRRRRQSTMSYSVAGHESEEQDVKQANTLAQMMIERTHPDEQDNYARALAAGQKVKVGRDGRIIAQRYQAGQIMANGRAALGGELNVNANGTIAGAVDAEDVSHDYLQRRAGLDQAARLGGEGNIDFIQGQFERAMAGGDTHEVEMMNQFTTANVQSLFAKLPHIYKNNNYAIPGHREEHDVVRTVNGLNANDVTALSGVGMRTLRDNLMVRAQQMAQRSQDQNLTAAERQLAANESQNSVGALQRLGTVFQQATIDPSLRGRIPADVARAMRDLATWQLNGQLDPVLALDAATMQSIEDKVNDQGVVVN